MPWSICFDLYLNFRVVTFIVSFLFGFFLWERHLYLELHFCFFGEWVFNWWAGLGCQILFSYWWFWSIIFWTLFLLKKDIYYPPGHGEWILLCLLVAQLLFINISSGFSIYTFCKYYKWIYISIQVACNLSLHTVFTVCVKSTGLVIITLHKNASL